MQNLFRRLRTNKPLLFGIYGAIGCLIVAMFLGEPFLALTKLAPIVQPSQAIVLLIDTSSSMSDGKLTEVKTAATKFVERRNLAQEKLAVVSFGLEITTATSLTNDTNTLKNAIATLTEAGGTPMAEGIDTAVAELQSTSLRRNILLFTDGLPHSQTHALFSAQSARNQSINLIAVATGDADRNYLAQLTGDSSLVFYASSGQFDQAFRNAEAAIYKQLVESNPTGDYGLLFSTLRIGGWTAFLAMGVILALIIGQNHYMHRRLLTFSKGIISTVGSLAAGMVAGAVGQLLFLPLTSLPLLNVSILEVISRIIGWAILGLLVGIGTNFFVPNLKFSKALFGGTVGGTLGAIGFVVTASTFGDLIGRLSGAAILGFFLGLMIAWVEQEQLAQEPYLLVHWTPREKTSLLLGIKPIIIGSSPNAQIPLNASEGFTPITAKIYQEEKNIVMQFDSEYAARKNMKKTIHLLNVGDTRKLGDITLEVKASISKSKAI
ncbi:MAG: VWA domain-containing protein [Scytonema sp. PMC 1069.18]|nr:VWA domain-containing protein [Scytonema sp. PMC 1069.18]MEC4880739.1 VWA domain-containing protein [Scytonema sp. PMC 1070.18]